MWSCIFSVGGEVIWLNEVDCFSFGWVNINIINGENVVSYKSILDGVIVIIFIVELNIIFNIEIEISFCVDCIVKIDGENMFGKKFFCVNGISDGIEVVVVEFLLWVEFF